MKNLAAFLWFAVTALIAAQPASADDLADRSEWHPYLLSWPSSGVDPALLDAQSATGKTLPMWTAKIVSPVDKKTYQFHIVGTNPQTNPVRTTLQYLPIVLRVHFANGVVLDPTKPACDDNVAVTDRFFKGPDFEQTALISNGVAVGTTQLGNGFMRAQFWGYAKGTEYGVLLQPGSKVKVFDVDAPSGSLAKRGICAGQAHDIGEINVNAYDALVQRILKKNAEPSKLPLVLSYNIFETLNGCCIIGYHNTYQTAGTTQVYAVAAYSDAGLFSKPIEDIAAWSAEIGATLNDPLDDNHVPAWGHIGQEPNGCLSLLEVGDPLTGTPVPLTYDHFHYHPQELAFFSWFYRSDPIGTDHLASFEGTFSKGQTTVCTPQ